MIKKGLLLVLIFQFLAVFSQNFEVKGVVRDVLTNETIPFASIKIIENNKYTQSDINGNYSLKVPKGVYTIESEYFGYQKFSSTLTVNADVIFDIGLKTSIVELEEVVITAKKPTENIDEVEMGTEELKIEEIKKIPAFMGEVDIIKTITLLPGVTTAGEGASGFNVRGGNIDQNLVLMDDAAIYSSSHLFGFFSIFNSDAVDELKLYKGSIPSRFGGRLSSVLDVKQREGDYKEYHGQGGIGLVSSRATIEGPIKKDTASFLVSARRSYADLFLKLSKDSTLNQTSAFFYDLNTKLSYKLNSNNKLTLSGYYGRDKFQLNKASAFGFGNGLATAAWSHRFSDSSFSKVSLIYSNYSYDFDFVDFFHWESTIKNYQVKTLFTNVINSKHKIDYGVEGIYYIFKPAKVTTEGAIKDIFPSFELDNERAVDFSLFIGDEYTVNPRLSLQYGLRYNGVGTLGKKSSVQYEDGKPRNDRYVTDTVQYSSGSIVKFYHGFEPRFGLRYKLDSVSSIKGSYSRTRQNLHLVSNTSNSLPLDIYKMSDEYIKPAIADQVSLGYFRNIYDNKIELSAEVYYKKIQNILDYKNGADLLLNKTLEQDLLQGDARAFGLELMARKKKGRFTGWLSYTLSRTERKVKGGSAEETINFGDWYLSNYDKPHDVTFVGTYDVTKRLNVGLSFLYSTGRPITIPEGSYALLNNLQVPLANYRSRNNGRISDYHRLDLSATLEGKHKKGRQWEGSWTFSIYNVYARRNAFSWSFQEDEDNPDQLRVSQLSILGSVLPAVTYNFKF